MPPVILWMLGRSRFWVCDADGSKVRRLNRTPAVCYMPGWQLTPRGERIVFGKHGDKPEMASIKPDGSGEQILGEGHDPTLSPDGKQICYTGEEGGGVTVFVMNYDGSNKRQVVKEISVPASNPPAQHTASKTIAGRQTTCDRTAHDKMNGAMTSPAHTKPLRFPTVHAAAAPTAIESPITPSAAITPAIGEVHISSDDSVPPSRPRSDHVSRPGLAASNWKMRAVSAGAGAPRSTTNADIGGAAAAVPATDKSRRAKPTVRPA